MAPGGSTGKSAFAIVPVGPAGSLTVSSSSPGTRVAVDVVGWFDSAAPDQSDDTFRSAEPITVASNDPAAASTVAIDLADAVPTGSGAVALSIRPVGATTELQVAPGGDSFDGRPTAPVADGESFVTVARLSDDDTVEVRTSAALARLDVTVLGTFDRAIAAPPGSSWQFDPQQWITFTTSGQGRSVQLVNIGADGYPTGAYLTPGTRLVVAGDPASVTVKVTGRGTATLRSTATVGSVNLIATPVDGLHGMPVVAKNVLLVPGVRIVQDDKIVFPDRTLPGGGSPEPFTVDEIAARVLMPAEDDPDPFKAGARVAVVMRGRAPAAGTVLAGVGNTAVTGMVVAPDGLPNLNRGGMSLVTIEYISPTDVYTDLRYEVDISTSRLIDGKGAVSQEIIVVDTGFVPRPTPTMAAPSALRSPVNATASELLPACEVDVELAKAEFKLFSYEGPVPKFTLKADYEISGKSLQRFRTQDRGAVEREGRDLPHGGVGAQDQGGVHAEGPSVDRHPGRAGALHHPGDIKGRVGSGDRRPGR